jgi:hypothetical protein
MKNLAALIVLIAAFAAATTDAYGQTRRTDAVTFLDHVVRLLAANDYQAAYPLLHPEQRRLVTAWQYVACEQMSLVPGKLTSLRVLQTKRERIHVAGTKPGRVTSTAVSFELQIAASRHQQTATIDLTAHAVSVRGRWTWILPAPRLALYRSGACSVVAN